MNNRFLQIGLLIGVGLLGFGFGRLSVRQTSSVPSTTAGTDALPVVTGSGLPNGVNVDPSGGEFHQSTNLQVDPSGSQDLQGALQVSPNELNNLDLN